MVFNSSDRAYTGRFIKHVEAFIREHELFGREDPLLVTLSGGIDSISLLYTLVCLKNYGYSGEVRAIHINHQTRIEHDSEEVFAKEFCKQLGVKCIAEKIKNLDIHSNFENNARVARYNIFEKIKKPNERIVLGHHIDDSFEWSLLQSLRSSNVEGLIGIPVVNGDVVRPFMCVTKKQITKFSNCFDLPFLEDPTNEELRFERNFIRNQIVEGFKDRYPQYLKHYVYRHNEIARRFGVHLVQNSNTTFNINFGENTVLLYSLKARTNFSGIEDLIKKALKFLNPNSRGKLSGSIKQIKTALENNKYGPITLTNGVKVYLDFNTLLFVNTDFVLQSKKMKRWDVEMTIEQYYSFLIEHFAKVDIHCLFPMWVSVKTKKFQKGRFNTSFETESFIKLQNSRENYFSALKLLREWSKKQHRHKTLKLSILT